MSLHELFSISFPRLFREQYDLLWFPPPTTTFVLAVTEVFGKNEENSYIPSCIVCPGGPVCPVVEFLEYVDLTGEEGKVRI